MCERRSLRPKQRISYFEPEEPNLDEYIFCEQCGDYVYEYCSIHGALAVIPDDKVPDEHNFPSFVPRAALTIPKVFLHLNYSSIPGAGLGVFSTLTLPKGVRFGPYRGVKTKEANSDYCWQMYDRERRPAHVVDAADGNASNWMRFVNCSRHWREQNLLAFQYRGELYYRTIKIIPRFTELMVFYGSEFANKLHIDLGKYNAPKSYAHKFGAPAPKKPKTNPENKSPLNGPVSFTKDKEKKTSHPATLDNTLTPAISAQKKKNNKRSKRNHSEIEKDAPAAIKRKTKVENKNLQLDKANIKLVEQNPNALELEKECVKTILETEETELSIKPGENVVKELINKQADINTKLDVPIYNNEGIDPGNIGTTYTQLEETHGNQQCVCHTSGFATCDKLNEHTLSQKTDKKLEKPYSCSICDYKCTQAINLKRHLRTHTGEKPYSCSICDYKCTQAIHLKRHLRTHTGEKPYSCSICDYKCTQAIHLKSHLRTHTGEKPYSCSICDYKCTQAISLKSHLRTHTGEKPYSCSICDYKSSQAGNLKTHLRTHTGEKPYSCSICDYKSSQAGNLKTHLRTHTGEKPYACDICDYRCSSTSSLTSHLKKHLS